MFFNELRIHKSAGLAGSQAWVLLNLPFQRYSHGAVRTQASSTLQTTVFPDLTFIFEAGFHVAQSGTDLIWLFCLHLPSVDISGVCQCAKFTSKSSFRLKAELSRRHFASPRQAYTFSHHTWRHPSGWQMQQPYSHAGISQTPQFTLGLTCSSVLSVVWDTWWHVMVIPLS